MSKMTCIGCEKEKPEASFDRCESMGGARNVRCRTCVTKRYHATVKRMKKEGVPDLRHDTSTGLTIEDQEAIIEAHSSGEMTYRELADFYPASKSTIANLCREARKKAGEV